METSKRKISVNLKFYAIRNNAGHYFKNGWRTDIENARLYQNIGVARTLVTRYKLRYPLEATPEIIEIVATDACIINETDRVQTILKAKNLRN